MIRIIKFSIVAAIAACTFMMAINPAVFAYSVQEEKAILESAGLIHFELPENHGITGNLAACSRNLALLDQYLSGNDEYSVITQLAAGGLPDAGLSMKLQEDHEACGPERFFDCMIFENGQVKFSSPFYLYDPGSRLFSLGGVMPVDEIVEILVRRIDGFLACMRSDGRVVFIAENVVELMIGKDNQPEISQESYTGPFRYRRLLVKGALIHMVEADLKYHSFSTSVSPYYDKINPGSARTLFVDDLARRAGAKAAINGTFFNMDPGSELYGWPVGSFFASGKLLHSLDSPSLNALNRSYLAFTNGGRLIVGETNQKGTEILRLNQAGSFDSAKFGSERIAAFGGGFGWLVKNGDPQAWKAYAGKQFDPSFYSRTSRRARSLVGVDAGGRHIFMLAQEEGSSSPTPMSHPELAEYIAATTTYKDVVFLDGGGSTQLVIDGKNASNPSNGGSYRKNSSALLLMP